MNGYNLIRNWYNFKFENPDKTKSIHSDFYCYLVDQWNRLGQKTNFGLPTSNTMECLGIGSYNTYKKALEDLIDFGFVKIVLDSKNQHKAKVITLSNSDKATDKALDKASIKASDKATDTIDKQINKGTNKQVDKSRKEKIEGFLGWFNQAKKIHTGTEGKFRMLSKTDENNLFKLLKVYTHKDFEEAIPKLYASEWAKENQMFTPTHFLVNNNFNKYLNQEIKRINNPNQQPSN